MDRYTAGVIAQYRRCEMEKRAFELEALEVRKEDDGPVITGYAAVFNRLSQMMMGFREKIAPGAFAGSLADDIRALWQHEPSQVLGRTRAGTLAIWEDERGLGFELKPPDTQVGRDAMVLISRGDVDQMSFGFNVLPNGDTWDEDKDGMLIRTLKAVRLIEISAVTFPAYQDTSVEVVREAPEWVQRALTQGVEHSREPEIARARRLPNRKLFDTIYGGER